MDRIGLSALAGAAGRVKTTDFGPDFRVNSRRPSPQYGSNDAEL
jgi:hypothetical protein